MNLLAAAGGAWILDAIFFGILLIGLIIGALRGFVRSIAKMAGTIFSFIVAFLFCIQFSALLENWFHLTTALAGAIKNAKIAYWLCVALSFILLVILTKLAAWLLGKLGKSIVHRSKLLGAVDRANDRHRFIHRVFAGRDGNHRARHAVRHHDLMYDHLGLLHRAEHVAGRDRSAGLYQRLKTPLALPF